MHYIFNSERRR